MTKRDDDFKKIYNDLKIRIDRYARAGDDRQYLLAIMAYDLGWRNGSGNAVKFSQEHKAIWANMVANSRDKNDPR